MLSFSQWPPLFDIRGTYRAKLPGDTFGKAFVKLFRFGATHSKPKTRLRAGVTAIATVLAPHGFRFVFRESGSSSGGPFAFGEFVRGDRRLELHVRESLGLVRYHLGLHSASHEYYMKELGEWPRCDYPGLRIPRDGDQRSELMSITIPK
jgi:hypothetical protein